MKQLNYFLAIAIAGTAFFSCNDAAETKTAKTETPVGRPAASATIENAAWLIGSWKCATPDGAAYEIWAKESDAAFAGKSFFVKGQDTIPQETMRLEKSGTGLCYIPTVPDQNGGKPVTFTVSTATENEMVFENPTHDFPQKISYKRITNDSMVAEISGSANGKNNSAQFPMARVK